MHCIPDPEFTIGKAFLWRNVIEESPSYQRESAIWSIDKQQLFVDSLLNGIDIPKVYLHDLRGNHATKHYAIVDGKQRLTTIRDFMSDRFPLAADFTLSKDQLIDESLPPPAAGSLFSTLGPFWQDTFKSKSLSVVLIQNATEEDIEELFSRLNNGEPLNAAEKRNAKGGDMAHLIREMAGKQFFTDRVRFTNSRYSHYEVAAKFLIVEYAQHKSGAFFSDLKKRFLDRMVEDNRNMLAKDKEGLAKRVDGNLGYLDRVFTHKDPLLSKQAYPPLYYLFVKAITRDYAHDALYGKLHAFLEWFQTTRVAELSKPEEQQEVALIEFGRLMQQGTNDLGSLERRVQILTRYFLRENPDVLVRDRDRDFTEEERFAIWVAGAKRCANCQKELPDISDMHADHAKQWSWGGPTSLENARALCGPCNTGLAQGVG